MRKYRYLIACGAVLHPVWWTASRAQSADPVSPSPQIVVTATRIPEPADKVPAFITSLGGDDLRARGAYDLRTALALVAGVQAPEGGDAGPASAVPSFWGLHEFDAFLLVVDGVPLGGAFNPAIPSLDLTNVERIEVLKGSAPVVYGATSFVGVIQVIHYPAGESVNEFEGGFGTHGSFNGSLSTALPKIGDFSQSISLHGGHLGFQEDREKIDDFKSLYRLAGPLAGGTLRLDLDLSIERTIPSSPIELEGDGLTNLTPKDANYNPADARIDENRYHAVLGYTRDTPIGTWQTTASYAYYRIRDVRGFLRPDLNDDGSPNADSQAQLRRIDDVYADTHLGMKFGALDVAVGADLLYGSGRQQSVNGEYYAPLSGEGRPPPTTALHVDEINGIDDRRAFVGEYLQLDWKPTSRLDITAGGRLNETYEHKISTHLDGFDTTADTYDVDHRRVFRPSGAVGLTFQAWRHDADEVALFADYRNTFKPAAVDFGPDVTPAVLKPEAARSYEIGLKGTAAGGRLTYQAGLFLLDFSNLVVATTDANGDPLMENAGGERLKGIEVEGRYRLGAAFALAGSASYHDARFTRYIASEGGANIDVSGNRLTLSPRWLAALGLNYAAKSGPFATVTANYNGSSYLDLENSAVVRAYITVDATAGWRLGRYRLSIKGYNLSNSRRPVTASEFGDQSFYLLPGRRVLASLATSL